MNDGYCTVVVVRETQDKITDPPDPWAEPVLRSKAQNLKVSLKATGPMFDRGGRTTADRKARALVCGSNFRRTPSLSMSMSGVAGASLPVPWGGVGSVVSG